MVLELHSLLMHNYPQDDVFLDHNMKLQTMMEVYLKYDNMHINGTINVFICIKNHLNSCIKCILSGASRRVRSARFNPNVSISWTSILRITIDARKDFAAVDFINEIGRLRLIGYSANCGGTRGFMRIHG